VSWHYCYFVPLIVLTAPLPPALPAVSMAPQSLQSINTSLWLNAQRAELLRQHRLIQEKKSDENAYYYSNI
jgi:hypothetical protein